MRKLLQYFWRTALVFVLTLSASDVFASVYLNETFDALANGIPDGWSSAGDITQDKRFAAYQYGYSGRCLRFDSGDRLNPGQTSGLVGKKEILMAPAVEVSGNVTVSFWYRNQNAGEFAVYVSRDNGATYEGNVLLSPTTEGKEWTFAEYAVPCSRGDQVRVVFVATSNGTSDIAGGAYIFLDEVKVEDVPTCAKPVSLSIYEATPTSATFMWSILANAGAAPSEYLLELWKDGVKVRTETATDQMYMLEGLEAGTTYTLLVKGDCNYIYQLTSPSASITFTTPCAAQNLPYSENFDSQRSGLLPCWTVGGTNPLTPALQTNYKDGDSGAAMKIMATEAYSAYAITPTLHATQMENLVVEFKAFAIEHSQKVEVGIMTNPYDFSTYAPIGTATLSANSWEEYAFNTSVLADYGIVGEGDFYVVFNAEAGIPATYYVDNLGVAVPDACPRPTDFKATAVTASSITLAWEETTTPTARTLTYSLVDEEGQEGTPSTVAVTSNPYTLEGLQANSTYKLFLTLTCGSETSLESSTLTVSTPCNPTELGDAYIPVISNTLPECWTAILSSIDRSTGTVYPNASGSNINMQKDNLLAVCGFGIEAKNLRLSFTGVYTPANSTSSTSMTLEVGIMTDINDPNSFTTVHVVTLAGKNDAGGAGVMSDPTDFELLMDEVPAEGEFIAFRASDACSLSNIKIDLIPECISPVNLRMAGYGKDYVEYAWDARRNVTSFKIKINGEDKGTVTANSYRLENLTPGTQYNHSVEIVSVCNGADGESIQQDFSFTTYCDLQTITAADAYETTFGEPSGAYPACWEIVNENPLDPYSGNYHLHSSSGAQMLALPGFTNPLGDLRLTITVNMPSGNLLVGYVTDLTDPESFVTIQTIEGGSWDNTTYSVAYPTCPDGAYMALAADELETAQIILVDAKVDLKPTCVSTVKVSNHESTTTTIGVVLSNTQTETAWDVVIVPSGQPVTSGTIQTVQNTNPTFSDLTSGTSYDIYVRPNCGEGEISEWTGPYTAATLCENSQMPYLMDFSAGMSPCFTVTGSVKWEVNNKWGDMAANLPSTAEDGSSALLITGGINIPEGTAALLTFDMYRGADNLGNTYNPMPNRNVMKVYVNNTPSLQGAQLLRTINNSYLGLPAETSVGMHTYQASIPMNGETVYVIFEQVMNTYDAGQTSDWMNPQDRQVSTIDNIKIEEAAGCFTPFIESVQATTSSATIRAKGSSSATEYRFTIGEETRTSETNTITWDGLLPDMEYAVTVSTDCGEEGESEVSVPFTFRTRCTALATPVYNDGFEEGLTQLLCWTTNGKLETVTTAYEGGAGLSLSSGFTYLLPEMEITDVRNLELSFMAYGLDLTNQMTIGVAKDANDISGTFSSAKTITVKDKNKWREIVVTFETVGEDYKDAHFIAINMPAGQNVIIDNIKVKEKPACPKVTNMNVVVYGDELAVTWESQAEKTEFLLTKNGEEIQRTTVENDPAEDVQSTTLPWVEQNTAGYVLTARSVCGTDNYSEWTVDYTFRTPCNRVEVLPYTQNFENLGLTAESFTVFPDCWTKVVMHEWSGSGGKMLPALTYKDGHTIGKVALWMWEECMVALPEMMEPIGNLTLTFKAYCAGQEGEELEVGVLESLDQPDAFVVVQTIPKIAGEFVEFEVNFTGYSGRYIAIRNGYSSDYRLDDFKISITPNCLRPTGVSVTSVSETTANLSIVDPSNNTSWEVVMVPTGVDVSEGTVQAFASKTGEYTGLQGSKIYDVYVRGCKGNDKSEWMLQPAACRTDCASGSITLPFAESFEDVQMTNLESMYISECWTLKQIAQGEQGTGTDYGDEAWSLGTAHVHGGTVAATLFKGRNGARTLLISPKLNVPTANAYEVVFWMYRQAGTTKDLEGVRVWTNYQQDTLGGQMLAYIPHYGGIQADDAVNTVSEEGWYEYAVVIPQADNALYVIFEGISQGGADIYVDDIEIRAIPSCRKPERVIVDETTPISVTITIDDPVGTAWDVAVMKRDSLMEDGFQPVVMSTVNENTATISGLQPASDYDLYVRANCGDETSEWSSVVQFSTTCVAKTVTADAPFIDNFDMYEDNSMPLCWSTPLYNAIGTVVYPMVEKGPMSYFYWSSRTCLTLNNCIAVLPEFTNDVRDLVISFAYAGYGKLELGVIADPLDMNTFVPMYELDAEENSTVQFRAEAEASMLNFLQYEGEAHYIAFRVQESNSLLVDDVVVSLYSDCEAPQSVVVKDVTSESATIEVSDLRSNFDYAIVEAGEQVSVENIVAANEANLTYNVTGLAGSTTYDVYVRAYCDGQPGYWSKPVSFTTLCGVETVTEDSPYVVFETLTETDNCYTVLSGKLTNYGANYGNYVTASTVLLLPEFTNSLSDLEVYVETGRSANFKMEAGFLTNPADPTTFVVGGELILAAQNSSGTVSVGTLQPTSNLAIRIVGADTYNTGRYATAYVKKIQVQMKPGFFLPKNLSVTNLTHNGATVTAEIGRETTECKWMVNDVEQSSTTTDGVLNMTDLTEQTEYTVKVQATDGSGTWTAWSDPVVFSTLCAPKELPYTETFDADELPACWDFSQQVTLSAGSLVLQAGDYAIVPIVNATLTGTQISVTYTSTDDAVLSVGSANAAIDTYVDLQNLNSTSESATAVVSLKNVPADHTNIVLMVSNGTATIEEVTVDVLGGSCYAPTNIELESFTNETATFTWKAGNDETAWNVTCTVNDEVKETVSVETPSYELTNLTAGTEQEVKISIASACDAGSASIASEAYFNFTTECDLLTITDDASYISDFTAGMPACWADVVPGTNFSGGKLGMTGNGVSYIVALPGFTNDLSTLTVMMTAGPNGSEQESMELGYITNVLDPSTFVTIATLDLGSMSTVKSLEYDLASVDVTDARLALRANPKYALTVYDLEVALTPTLERPEVKVVATKTSFDLTITADATATEAEVVVVEAGADRSSGTVETITLSNGVGTHMANGLNEASDYDIYVRISEPSKSFWTKVTKSTLCYSGSLPYMEDFNGFMTGVSTDFEYTYGSDPKVPTNPTYPDCWTFLNIRSQWEGPWAFLADIEGESYDGVSLYFGQGYMGDMYAVLPSVGIDTRELRLSFKYRMVGNNSMTIGVMSDPNDETTFVEVATLVNQQTYSDANVSFDNAPEGYDYVAIKHPSGGGKLWIDDVRLACVAEPETVSATICSGEEFVHAGIVISADQLQPGLNEIDYVQSSTNDGCDKRYHFEITVEEPDETIVISDVICSSDEPYVNDEYDFNITNPQTMKYYMELPTEGDGCAQLVCLDLVVENPIYIHTATVCKVDLPYEYEVDGELKQFNESGVYDFSIALPSGCDSIVRVDLTVNHNIRDEYRTICEGDSVLFQGVQHRLPGDYAYPLGTETECGKDTVVLHLTVLPLEVSIDTTICPNGRPSDGIQFGTEFITEPGDYQRTYENELGCEVTEYLHVAFTELEKIEAGYMDVCYGEYFDGYQHTDGRFYGTIESVTKDTAIAIIIGATNDYCGDSLYMTVRPIIIPETTRDTVVTEADLPFQFGGVTVSGAGSFTGTFESAQGCDSIVHLNVQVQTGVQMVHAGDLILRPNPVQRNHDIFVDYQFTAQERDGMRIEVANSIGQVISIQTQIAEQVTINPIPVPGFYTVRIVTGDNKYYTAKVLVK